jgi:hypothetical protein
MHELELIVAKGSGMDDTLINEDFGHYTRVQ